MGRAACGGPPPLLFMSNRSLKLQLHAEDPRCHWCKRVTKLTNDPAMKGKADPLMATIDHVVSRYHPSRWVKQKEGEQRKVLACYECNHNRSVAETNALSRAEILRRSKGFNLNPKGNPVIIKPLLSLDEVLDKMGERGIVVR